MTCNMGLGCTLQKMEITSMGDSKITMRLMDLGRRQIKRMETMKETIKIESSMEMDY